MHTNGMVAGATIIFLVACSAGDHARPSLDTGGGGSAAASGTSGSTGGDSLGGSGGSQNGGSPSSGGTAMGGSLGSSGATGTGGFVASGGFPSTGGFVGSGGSVSTGGFVATGGSMGTGGTSPGAGETGRLVGMTDAHNLVRSSIATSTPIPNLTWSTTIAAVAQAYADQLANSGCNLVHSGTAGYGENLAQFGGAAMAPADVVSAWAGESACYTYGLYKTTDSCTCVNSGCGHYTQVVWRTTTEVGCGVAVCPGLQYAEIWVCNYSPPGNYVGVAPY